MAPIEFLLPVLHSGFPAKYTPFHQLEAEWRNFLHFKATLGFPSSNCLLLKSSITFPLQSWQTGAISEIPSTWLTLFDPSWRSPEILSYPTYRPTQAAFPCEWLVLAHVSQLPKSPQIRNSWHQWASGPALAAASLYSQLSFILESPSPAQVAVFSDCFIAQAGWPLAKER